MAGKFNEPKYRPKAVVKPYRPDFTAETDFDYIHPYPCGVCRKEFNSRYALANHRHDKKENR